MRYMGGLRKRMPITYWTGLVGTLALVGTPFFSGFYSKDAIIEAVHHSTRPGAGYAYFCVMLGVFVTALYSFRLLYLTFHGKERFHDKHAADYVVPEADSTAHEQELAHEHEDEHGHHEPHESPWVVTLPLVLLAIPSLAVAFFTVGPMLFGGFFDGAIVVREANDVLAKVGHEYHGPLAFALHGFTAWPFWLAFAGFAVASAIYLLRPELADRIKRALKPVATVLERKYYFDDLYQAVFARGSVLFGRGLWKGGDVAVIDGVVVDGSATLIDRIATLVRRVQSGYLYHYAFAMILGLIALLGWLVYQR
jgi:NADH-quinone oxidoreductase subunit L